MSEFSKVLRISLGSSVTAMYTLRQLMDLKDATSTGFAQMKVKAENLNHLKA